MPGGVRNKKEVFRLRTGPDVFFICFVMVCIYLFSLGLPLYSNLPIMGLSLAGLVAARNSRHTAIAVLKWPLLAFAASYFISLCGTADIQRSLMLSISFVPALVLCFLIADIRDMNQIRMLYAVLSALAMLISLLSCRIPLMTEGGDPAVWIRQMGNPHLLVPNDLIMLTILLPFSFALLQSGNGAVIRGMSLVSVFLTLCALTLYQSRGALMIVFISLTGMLFFFRSGKFLISAVCLLTIAAGADWLRGFPLLSKFSGIWTTRVQYWLIAWQMFKDAPFFGQGPRTYGGLYTLYKDRVHVPEWLAIDERISPWPHNLYLEVLAEQGGTGLVSLIFLMAAVFFLAWKTFCFPWENAQTKIFCFAALTAFFNISIAALFELSFVRHWVPILFFGVSGMILAFNQLMSKEKEK